MGRLWQVGWFRWLVMRLLIAGALYAAIYTTTSFLLQRAVGREVQALHAAGFPVYVTDLDRRKVPEAEDAGPLFRAAEVLCEDAYAERPNLEDSLVILENGRLLIDAEDGMRPATEAEIEQAESLIRKYGRILEIIDQAAERPGFNSQVKYEDGIAALLPAVIPDRRLARLSRAAAELACHRGDFPAAVRHLAAIKTLTRACRDEPVLICLLVRIAMEDMLYLSVREIVAAYPVPEERLAALQKLLAYDSEDDRRAVAAVAGEVLMMTTTVQTLLRGQVPTLDERGPASGSGSMRGLPRLWLLLNELEYLRFWRGQMEELKAAGWPERPVQTPHPGMTIPRYAVFARVLAPNFNAVWSHVTARETSRRVTAWGVALRRHKLQTGSYPDRLDDLPPSLRTGLGEAVDPFSGQPLVYRREGDGFFLCSFGPNGKDDGGKIDRETRADDIAFRVTR